MKKTSFLLENISLNSYAAEEGEQGKISYKVKIMVLGAKSVGKSTILQTLTQQKKPKYQIEQGQRNAMVMSETEGIDFVSKVMEVDNVQYHLHIWDTADYKQNFQFKIPNSLYNNVLAFIIVYDITRRDSFEIVMNIFSQIQHKGHPRKEIFMIGTNFQKASRGQRQVKYQQAQKFAVSRSIRVMQLETKSAKDVEDLFDDLLNRIISKNIFQSRGPKISMTGTDGFQKRYNRCC